MQDGLVLKHRPEDFLVRENMVVALCQPNDADHHHVILRKNGFTTMEAVRIVADELGLSSRAVTYGGLKDEDGITEQLISVPRGSMPADVHAGGWRVREDGEHWMDVFHYGYGQEPLAIGKLEGNSFQLVVRKLDEDLATKVERLRKVNLLFLNYYDTQRFGVPGGPKRTHRVGAAILAEDWDTALSELVGLRAPESAMAEAWTGSAGEFFCERLDPRTTSFYLAAYSSDHWNQELCALVDEVAPADAVEVDLEGLRYRYAPSMAVVGKLMGTARELPYDRYTFLDATPSVSISNRPTVVQSIVTLGEVTADTRIPEKYEVRINFALPSGCYATTAIRQLFRFIQYS